MKIDWKMETTDYIWLNGEFVRWEDAHVHVLSHALHYGDAVFEGVRFYNTDQGPAIFRLKEHTDRLFYSASALEMEMKFSQAEINQAQIDLINKNNVPDGYIRPLIFYGAGKMGLNPKGAPVDVVIACWPWGKYLGDQKLRVKTSKYIRIHPKSTVADAKISGHYVNSILASLEIHKAGYHEALLLDFNGNIAEGPGENFFMVKNGKIYTTPLGTVLKGITRDAVFKMAKEEGIEVIEKLMTLEEAYQADELFFTGTAAEISAISELDDHKIADGEEGKITKLLKEKFMDIVAGKNEKYFDWLTFTKK